MSNSDIHTDENNTLTDIYGSPVVVDRISDISYWAKYYINGLIKGREEHKESHRKGCVCDRAVDWVKRGMVDKRKD